MGAAELLDLRRALERRFPDALPLGRGVAPSVATGLGVLDRLLPGGGLARGRVTAWLPGGGATAVLRAAGEAAVQRGERAAWVDASGSQTGDFWRAGLLLVRPSSMREALASAEELLRSGGFVLVVLWGAEREAGREAVRLSRAARTGGSVLVLGTATASIAHLRVQTRIAPEGYRWRVNAFGEPVDVEAVRVEVEASSLGWSGRALLELPVRTHGLRLNPEPLLIDRRGALPSVRYRRLVDSVTPHPTWRSRRVSEATR